MSFPILLVAGAGLLLALAAGSKGKIANGSTVRPGTGKYDSPGGAVMPLTLEQTVDRELAADNSPANLLQLAASLSPMYPRAVALLQARAAQLQARPTGAPVQPPPAPVPVPVVPVTSPVVPPVAAPYPPPDPSPAPIVTIDPSTGGTVTTLPPITITPTAPGVSVWDPSYGVNVRASIPGAYAQQSDETAGVQGALNAWALQVSYDGGEMPLAVDGRYGQHTATSAANFQSWVNATQGGNLAVDGLAGPETQSYLAAYGDIPSGPY